MNKLRSKETYIEQILNELVIIRQGIAQINQRITRIEESLVRVNKAQLSEELNLSQTRIELQEDKEFQFPNHPQLQKIFTFIESHYNCSISLNEIAKEFDYSPSYLTGLVRRITGKTLYQWIVQRRMFAARLLLRETDLSVYEIADKIGYSDAGHFVKHFRRIHGKPPKNWKETCNHEKI